MEDKTQVEYRNVKKGLVAADFEGTQAGRVVARGQGWGAAALAILKLTFFRLNFSADEGGN